MTVGPGKYDQPCTLVRDITRAESVVLIVLNGERGSGFSVQGPLELQWVLPDLLEMLAKQIRADLPSELPNPGEKTQ